MRSYLGHISISFVQISKVDLQVYFAHDYLKEFQFWSSKIHWQENLGGRISEFVC